MRRLIAIFKNSLHTIGMIVAILVAGGYLFTHFNLSGYIAKNELTGDLADYLGTEVSLENAEVDIFNQFIIENLLVKDQLSDTLLFARRVMVSFDLLPLLQKELQIHTIQLIDFDLHLAKQDSLSETNFQFLIDRFVPKGGKKKGTRKKVLEDIVINSVILRSGNLIYDDFSKAPHREFLDINHLFLKDISANLKIQSSKKDGLYANLKRMSFNEKSGLAVSRASAVAQIDAGGKKLDFNDIRIVCEQSLFARHTASINLVGFASMENQKLDGEIVSLKVDVPDLLKLESNGKAEDILSFNDSLSFDVVLNKLNITSRCLSLLSEKYDKNLAKNAAIYINNVSDIDFEGKAAGTMSDFSYSADIDCYGELNSEIRLRGTYTKENQMSCDVDAKVRNIELNKYTYDYIGINGTLTDRFFDGTMLIDDENCKAESVGKFYYKKKLTAVDAKVNIENFKPYSLNLTEIQNLKDVEFSSRIIADFSFDKNKYPLGKLLLDSVVINRDEFSYYIPSIDAKSFQQEEKYLSVINSQLLNANYEKSANSEKIQGEINESRTLSAILQLPFSITRAASVNLQLDSTQKIVNSEIILPEVIYDDASFAIHLTSEKDADSLKHILQCDYIKNDNHLATTMHATSVFDPLFIDIQPCKVFFNQDIIDCGGITLAKIKNNIYDLKRFILKQKEQSVNAKGKIAADGKSDLAIHIENLGIDTLCSFLDTDYLKFGGIGTGDIFYVSDSTRYVQTSNLFVKDFMYLGGLLGDTHLNAAYDVDSKRVGLVADVHSKEDSLSRISGYIQIAKKDSLDLMIEANKLNVEFLKYWVGGFLEDIQGNLTGDVRLYGLALELKLVGRPFADISFTNHLSGSRFYVRDSISLTKDEFSENGAFILNQAKIYDRFNHVARATANIQHLYLRKYNYDVRIDLPDDNSGFLLFDKPTHYNNELYWGQLFTTGTVLLRGGDSRHRIDISCRTTGRSQFNLSPGEENYSENGYNFLTFRDKKVFEAAEQRDYSDSYFINTENNADTESSSGTFIEFDLQAQATENCQVFVQMDPLAEDRLICRGTGNISLHYDPRNDITIGGEYTMSSGNYLVTMRGDLINKEFKIQNGSRVLFPGNFSNAELDINAVYSIPSVNLRDLDESFATMASMNRTTLPVDCKMAVTGQLNSPQIAFDLEVKNTSDDVQALVHNLIGTQEMLNREVFYLLLFSKFYTPEYASTSQNNSGSELTSFTSASLTSQLNNLLGHMSDYFTLGTNFRSDKGDFSDMEMDVSLSTRLFSDRLILNGNLGYRDPANRVGLNNNNNNSFIGDFDVEYLINPSGTLRMKAYSHYNERDYSINNALTTQGIGFVVRKDYKSIKELFRKNKLFEKK